MPGRIKNEKKVAELKELLDQVDKQGIAGSEAVAEHLVENGVERRGQAHWVKDETYKGANKDVFICDHCKHWQSVKKLKPNQRMYMNFCPFCGFEMI